MTVQDVRDRYGWSLLVIAARLVIVSMQYATLDSAQYNGPFTQLKLHYIRGYYKMQNMLHVIYLYTCSGYGHMDVVRLVWHSLLV